MKVMRTDCAGATHLGRYRAAKSSIRPPDVPHEAASHPSRPGRAGTPQMRPEP